MSIQTHFDPVGSTCYMQHRLRDDNILANDRSSIEVFKR